MTDRAAEQREQQHAHDQQHAHQQLHGHGQQIPSDSELSPGWGLSCISRAVAAAWGNGVTVIATAALLFSCSSLCVKVIMLTSPMPVFEITLLPSLVCLVGVLSLRHARGGDEPLIPASSLAFGLTLQRGMLGALSLSLFYLSIKALPLRDAVALFFTSPLMAALLEPALLPRQSLSARGIVGSVAAVLGVWLVCQPDELLHSRHTKGVLLATLAGAANASAFVTLRMMGHLEAAHVPSALVLTFWYLVLVALTSCSALMLNPPLAAALVPGALQLLLLACISAAQLCGQIMLNHGFSLLSATRGAAINALQVLFSYCLDFLVLRTPVHMLGLMGALLIVAGFALATASE